MNKTEFKENYNVVKILTDKLEIMKQLETFNDNNQAVAFGVRKQHTITTDERLSKIEETLVLIMSEIKEIKINQTKDHNLLINVIKLNNLKTE